MKKWLKRVVVAFMITSFTTVGIGCYGSFALTNKIYQFNSGLGNKFVRGLAFLGLIIIPVYEIAVVADAIFFNLLEFWLDVRLIAQEGGDASRVYAQGTNRVELSADKDGRFSLRTRGFVVESNEEGAVVRDAQGAVVATLRLSADGGAILQAAGRERVITQEELERFAELMERAMAGEPVIPDLAAAARGGVSVAQR